MPRFDFECTKCKKTFEEVIPFGSKDFPKCQKCNSKTKKLISPPAIHFKGSGFYVTDSKSVKKEDKSKKKKKDKSSKSSSSSVANK